MRVHLDRYVHRRSSLADRQIKAQLNLDCATGKRLKSFSFVFGCQSDDRKLRTKKPHQGYPWMCNASHLPLRSPSLSLPRSRFTVLAQINCSLAIRTLTSNRWLKRCEIRRRLATDLIVTDVSICKSLALDTFTAFVRHHYKLQHFSSLSSSSTTQTLVANALSREREREKRGERTTKKHKNTESSLCMIKRMDVA